MTGTCRVFAASANPASCAACQALPEEGFLSRHIFFSPSEEFSDAIDLFEAGVPDLEDQEEDYEDIDVNDDRDDIFADSASGVSHSRASIYTVQ